MGRFVSEQPRGRVDRGNEQVLSEVPGKTVGVGHAIDAKQERSYHTFGMFCVSVSIASFANGK